jgi:hypothetical protein
LACRWAGKALKLSGATALTMIVACVIAPRERLLSPSLLFTSGSSFLNNVTAVALKGRIEFLGDRTSQSGRFLLFMEGPDSLSFLVEGPFGADVFRMIILGETAYLLWDKDEGWKTIHRGEELSVEEYGIQNISPFFLGLFAFPQYYLHSDSTMTFSDERLFLDENIIIQEGQGDRAFMLFEPRSRVAAAYSERKDFKDGFYPAEIKIFEVDKNWQINLGIDKIRLDPQLPQRIWRRN